MKTATRLLSDQNRSVIVGEISACLGHHVISPSSESTPAEKLKVHKFQFTGSVQAAKAICIGVAAAGHRGGTSSI